MKKIAVVIPCYDEANRLDLNSFRKFLIANQNISFIFVNDGSQDETSLMLHNFYLENPTQLTVLDLQKNHGKAEAVRQGMCEIMNQGYSIVGYWDADLATPLHYIEKFSEILNDSKYNLVIGSRVKLLGRHIKRSLIRHYLGRIFATCASIVLQLPVYDTQCGAKLFRNIPSVRKAFEEPFYTDWIFDVELISRLLLLERNQLGPSVKETTLEYPLEEWEDISGSKLRSIHFIKAIFDLLKIMIILSRGEYKV